MRQWKERSEGRYVDRKRDVRGGEDGGVKEGEREERER